MKSFVHLLPLGFTLAYCTPLPGQMLAVDRTAKTGSFWLGKTDRPGFVADHFQVGERGDVWIVDAIRVWASGNPHERSKRLADAFENVTLFGGLEVADPAPGQPAGPECDCGHLMAIKTGGLRSGADVRASGPDGGAWQVDFENLHWSLPGGVPIQYGVMGSSASGEAWQMLVTEADGGHHLKAFDDKGKLEGPVTMPGGKLGDTVGLRVQVWAHKMATIGIHASGAQTVDVVLRTEGGFEAAKADPSSLRFGPKHAPAIRTHIETIDGSVAVVARFRRLDAGLQGKGVNACLTGKQSDGVPFEGCDIVRE